MQGFRALFYLDNGFNATSTAAAGNLQTRTVVSNLRSAGILVNFKKSWLVSTQSSDWHVANINTRDTSFLVLENKIVRLHTTLHNVLTSRTASARFLSIITGTLQAINCSLGLIVRLMTCYTYDDID